MPDFQTIVPVLRVADMRRALAFYLEVLGFAICWETHDADGENAMLQAGSVNLLLSTGEHLGGKPQFTGSLYFSLIDVEEYFRQIKEQVEIVWPLETMEYGQREFGIRDCDGYVLAFAQPADDSD